MGDLSAHKIQIRILKYFIVLGFLNVLLGCVSENKSKTEKISQMAFLMGTSAQMDVCRDSTTQQAAIEKAYEEVLQRLEEISWRMNVFDEKSDVAHVNQSYPQSVSIGADTYSVIQRSLEFSYLTHGAFDMTVWPLIDLWRKMEKENRLPTTEEIEIAKSAVGSQHVELLPNNQVRLKHPQASIDLGGIAAGFAIDEAAKIFRSYGISNFYIDIGGDIYAGGKNCEGNPWRIGIRDPYDQTKLVEVIELSDMAVTTSGDYEKFYVIGNERWSHILNPSTGYPSKQIVSATFIAPTTIEADALATALCVLGHPKATEFVNMLGHPYASLLFEKKESNRFVHHFSQEFLKFQSKR